MKISPLFPRWAAAVTAGVLSCAIPILQTAPASAQVVPIQNQKPNVLLILADDLGWSDLGCYGGEISTPNLDGLARDGLRFTQFYNSARCCPSRASLLTGLTPHQAGFPAMNGVLSKNAVTLPEVLKPAGYRTYMVGKWHLNERNTPVMRGFDEFYGMLGGFNSFWQEKPFYTRLPENRKQRTYALGEFYSTNAFGDYALDFLNESRDSKQPWFMYLAFNAPHFPLHAPESTVQKYEAMYREKGWDTIRAERLARQKKLGLVPANTELTPRSNVPQNWANHQTGWADKENPAWDSLPADRRADLARRMAVYAAMVEIMDQNVGRVIGQLKKDGTLDNTLIFFLSDNGACAEWDPYGFDGSSGPKNVLHTGEDLKTVGGPQSYISYGSGWANAANTPWRLYKHYGHEGGVNTPFIVHWPKGLKTQPGTVSKQVGSITDFMPTLVDICGVQYPQERAGRKILPTEGVDLLPVFQGKAPQSRNVFIEHEGNRMAREGDWKLVALEHKPWELYNLATDPTEMHNLIAQEPARAQKLSADWDEWAVRTKVKPLSQIQIVNRPLIIRCEVTADGKGGVVLAQGGNMQGYALHIADSKMLFSIRRNGRLTVISSPVLPAGRFSVEARLEKDGALSLSINGQAVARGNAPGLIPAQPQDELSIGEDTRSAVGDYAAPNAFAGKVQNIRIDNGERVETIPNND